MMWIHLIKNLFILIYFLDEVKIKNKENMSGLTPNHLLFHTWYIFWGICFKANQIKHLHRTFITKEIKRFAQKMPKEDVSIFSWREGLGQNNFVNLTPIYTFQPLQAYSCQWKKPTVWEVRIALFTHPFWWQFYPQLPVSGFCFPKILAMTEETMTLKFTTKTHSLC